MPNTSLQNEGCFNRHHAATAPEVPLFYSGTSIIWRFMLFAHRARRAPCACSIDGRVSSKKKGCKSLHTDGPFLGEELIREHHKPRFVEPQNQIAEADPDDFEI